jgi:hypothetical protein
MQLPYNLNRTKFKNSIMKRSYLLMRTILFSITLLHLAGNHATCQVAGDREINLSSSGWTLTANPASGILAIYHKRLGEVLSDVKLNIVSQNEIRAFTGWHAVSKNDNVLEITTVSPVSAWTFKLNDTSILISATSSDLCLTAKSPSPETRVAARLIDPMGVPVDWCGTREITVSFNGRDTHHPSRLPSDNPEVMTFALGQIDATNLHDLFDREKDIAISFSDRTRMTRSSSNQDQLDLVIPVPGNTMIRLIPDYYTKILGVPFYSRLDDSAFPSAPLIWGSWTAYYYEAKESDIVTNTDWLSKNLGPYGFQYVQLDDGYDRGRKNGHYWIEHWDKSLFPHGPEWLASYIKSKGFKPGLWLVPNSYAGFFDSHPDWYVYDTSGNVIKDYLTPALDYTNPAVQDWLKKLFSTLKGWGFEYFKFDGEFSLPAYVPDLDISRLYNKNADPVASYRDRLKLIRSVIGPGTFIEGCVAGTPLNGIGYFNSCFNGEDMYNSWKGSYAVFSSINANAFLNHMVIYVMPGEGIDVSPLMSPEEARTKMAPRSIEVALTREDPFTGFGVTLPEARTLVSMVSLTGVAYPLTSVMPRLPEERVKLLKMTMPTLPIIPVDLYSRGSEISWDKFKFTTPGTYIHNYPEITDLKVNAASGKYDVVAMTNWRNGNISRSVRFGDKLGLDPDTPYIVFDFWNQKLMGVFSKEFTAGIETHDTRVFLVHPLLGHPQLIANSRHISGVYSIIDLLWDESRKTISGSSKTIQGEPYSLFLYVPEGWSPSKIKAITGKNADIDVNSKRSGDLLRITLPGKGGIVKWEVQF